MWTIASFVFFTGLVGLVTWLLTRKRELASTDGYFLAGRSLGAGVIAGSLLLTNLSTEQLVGLNGAAFKDGLCVMAWEVVAGVSLVVMALFFLPRYLRRGITTIPQFLGDRFSDSTMLLTNMLFILAYMVILLPIILYTGATGLKGILNVSELTGIQSQTTVLWVLVWLIGTIGSVYAIFGGLRSVAISDTINGIGLLIGGVLISYLGLKFVGQGNLWQGLETLQNEHPEKLKSLGSAETSVPWPTLFSGVLLLNLFYWTTNQQIIQRTLAANGLAAGQKGVLLAATFKILAPLILVLPGIIAYAHFSTGQAGPNIEADDAYGTLVRMVLPPPLTGFFAAVIVGAILSSFNSALNATATLFSLGFYRKLIRPDADDRQTIRVGRIFGTIIAISAMTIAPLLQGQESIFGYLQKMNGLYFIPIFAVVLIGMLTRHVPGWAANVALVVGVTTIALGYFVPPLAQRVEQLHEFHFLGVVFVGLIVLMLVLSLGSNPPEPKRTARPQVNARGWSADGIDMTPWKYAYPAGGLLIFIVVAIYLYFAF